MRHMKLMTFLVLFMTCFVVGSQPLRVGLQPYDPPFSIQVDKNNIFSGFEAQLIAQICKRIQADCQYVPLPFPAFFPQLLANNIDLAIGQISITRQRSEQFLFSLPYLISSSQFITKNDSPIKAIEDMQGKKVGVFKGSLYKAYLLEKYNGQVTIIEYESSPGAFQALLTGDADALLLANIAEKYWITNSKLDIASFRFIGEPILLGSGYGIMASIQSTELVKKINKALMDIQSDGTYINLYNLYFGVL